MTERGDGMGDSEWLADLLGRSGTEPDRTEAYLVVRFKTWEDMFETQEAISRKFGEGAQTELMAGAAVLGRLPLDLGGDPAEVTYLARRTYLDDGLEAERRLWAGRYFKDSSTRDVARVSLDRVPANSPRGSMRSAVERFAAEMLERPAGGSMGRLKYAKVHATFNWWCSQREERPDARFEPGDSKAFNRALQEAAPWVESESGGRSYFFGIRWSDLALDLARGQGVQLPEPTR